MLFTQPMDSISNSEKIVLFGIWYIWFQYIYIIYSAVFVVENAIFWKNEFSLTQLQPAAICATCYQYSEESILFYLWSIGF